METGTDPGTKREGRRGWNRTGNGERGGKRDWVGQQGPETKSRPLVEDVSEYQEFYRGGGDD